MENPGFLKKGLCVQVYYIACNKNELSRQMRPVLLNPRVQLPTIYAGHAEIADYQVVFLLLHIVESYFTVFRFIYQTSEFLKSLVKKFAYRFFVVYSKDLEQQYYIRDFLARCLRIDVTELDKRIENALRFISGKRKERSYKNFLQHKRGQS